MRDLFSDLPEDDLSAPAPAALRRPTESMLTDRRFASRVTNLLTVAMRDTIPAEALPVVRRQVAECDGVDLTEIEIAAINHRFWCWIGRRDVPSFRDALAAVATRTPFQNGVLR